MIKTTLIGYCAAVLLLLSLAGCIKKSQPSQFFLLSALDPATTAALEDAAGKPLRISIGPVTFPEYLNQPQFVQRITPHKYELYEFTRWAEPLHDSFVQSFMSSLSAYLGTSKIYSDLGTELGPVDYQLSINVVRFECVREEICELLVNWSVRDSRRKVVIPATRAVFQAAPTGPESEELVAALSKTVAEFAKIAAESIARVS